MDPRRRTDNAGSAFIGIQIIPSGNIDINSGGTLYSQTGGSLTPVTGIIKVNAGGRFETRDTNNTAMTSVHTIQLHGGQLGTAASPAISARQRMPPPTSSPANPD